jgi:cysteine-rich repeat protein
LNQLDHNRRFLDMQRFRPITTSTVQGLFRPLRGVLLPTAFLLMAAPGGAFAQACAGDCNGDDMVVVSELVTGINIAGDTQPLDQCTAADVTDDGMVTIDESILAVRKALNGCLAICGDYVVDEGEECDDGNNVNADGCQANCLLPVCGDAIVDLVVGETCDDGNNDEGTGDSCPANCRIEACPPSGSTIRADVDFLTDPTSLLVSGLTLFIRYPDGVVGIPGSSGDPSVVARITSPSFSVTPNDQNYALSTVLLDPTFVGVPNGTAVQIEFDICEGAVAPSSDAFQCVVEDAADSALNPITEQVSCSVVLP